MGKALEFVRIYSADLLQGSIEDLSHNRKLVVDLGDAASAQKSVLLETAIGEHLELIKRVAQVVEERKDQAVLSADAAKGLKDKLVLVAFPSTMAAVVDLATPPTIKEIHEYVQ